MTYYAEILIRRKGEVLHREGRTFQRRALAKAWSAKRELELQQKEVFSAPEKLIISELINEYIENFHFWTNKAV
ncbi:MAG: hypothetical protein IBX55_14500 [Methyloprofundus sp.]|nr:hypothetical protein [Methyloprofundus sp.]